MVQAVRDRVALVEHALVPCGQEWIVLRGPICPIRAPRVADGAFPAVLLNPRIGVALLDVAPDLTAGAVERLRQTLDTHGFHDRYPGHLPIIHRVVPCADLPRLSDILDFAFAWQDPIDLQDGGAWADSLAEMLTGAPRPNSDGRMRFVASEAIEEHASQLGHSFGTRYSVLAALTVLGFAVAAGAAVSGTGGFLLQALGGLPSAVVAVGRSAATSRERDLAAPGFPTGRSERVVERLNPDPAPSELTAAPTPDLAAMGTMPGSLLDRGPNERPPQASLADLDDTADRRAQPVSEPPLRLQRPPDLLPTSVEVAEAPGDVSITDGIAFANTQGDVAGMAGGHGASTGPSDADALPAADAMRLGPMVDALAKTGLAALSADNGATQVQPWPAGARAHPAGTVPGRDLNRPEPGGSAERLPFGVSLSALVARGDSLLALGDISAARRFYERAAAAGSGAAAAAMGRTYDSRMLAKLRTFGILADASVAADWYRIAAERGDVDAAQLLSGLTTRKE